MLFFRIFDQEFSSDSTVIDQSKNFTIGSDLTSDICLIHRDFKFSTIQLTYDSVNNKIYDVSQKESCSIEHICDGLFVIVIENCQIFITTENHYIHGQSLEEIRSLNKKDTQERPEFEEKTLTETKPHIESSDSNDEIIQSVNVLSFFSKKNYKIFGAFGTSTLALSLLAFVIMSQGNNESTAKLSCSPIQSAEVRLNLLFEENELFSLPTYTRIDCDSIQMTMGASFLSDKILEEGYFHNQSTLNYSINNEKINFYGFTSKDLKNLSYTGYEEILKTNIHTMKFNISFQEVDKYIANNTVSKEKVIKDIYTSLYTKMKTQLFIEMNEHNTLIVYVNKKTNIPRIKTNIQKILEEKKLKLDYEIEQFSLNDLGISSIIQGEKPYFLSTNGQKYFEGSYISKKIKIKKINHQYVSFLFNGTEVTYPL